MDEAEERFWAKVEKTPGDGCWLWRGSIQKPCPARNHPGGYGFFVWRGKVRYAHRVSWAIHYGDGDLPPLHVLHRCDTPACVRPDHLFLGTQADNMADKVAKGRAATGERNGQHTRPDRKPKGERHGMTTLTEDDVREIRRRFAAGERQTRIAPDFGITSATVSNIVHRKTWGHLL